MTSVVTCCPSLSVNVIVVIMVTGIEPLKPLQLKLIIKSASPKESVVIIL